MIRYAKDNCKILLLSGGTQFGTSVLDIKLKELGKRFFTNAESGPAE